MVPAQHDAATMDRVALVAEVRRLRAIVAALVQHENSNGHAHARRCSWDADNREGAAVRAVRAVSRLRRCAIGHRSAAVGRGHPSSTGHDSAVPGGLRCAARVCTRSPPRWTQAARRRTGAIDAVTAALATDVPPECVRLRVLWYSCAPGHAADAPGAAGSTTPFPQVQSSAVVPTVPTASAGHDAALHRGRIAGCPSVRVTLMVPRTAGADRPVPGSWTQSRPLAYALAPLAGSRRGTADRRRESPSPRAPAASPPQ